MARTGARWIGKAVAASAGLMLALAGCSGDPTTSGPVVTPTPGSPGFVFVSALYYAERADASPEQIAALQEAIRTGELSYETVTDLVEQTFACFEESGIEYQRRDPEELGPGFLAPAYTHAGFASGMTNDQALAVADFCIDTYSNFAVGAYRNGPASWDARDARLREELPQIVECLTSNGVTASTDDTLDEIRLKVADLLRQTTDASNGEGAVACSWDYSTQDQSAPQS